VSPNPFGDALSGNFNEPANTDPTSAPVENVPPGPGAESVVAKTLAKRKKGFGPGVKNPAALGRAIALARRAKPSNQKYG
jgi:hypothetical protein